MVLYGGFSGVRWRNAYPEEFCVPGNRVGQFADTGYTDRCGKISDVQSLISAIIERNQID